jgi:hypothetical protein
MSGLVTGVDVTLTRRYRGGCMSERVVDDGTIWTATYEQLKAAYDNVDSMEEFLVDSYTEWVDGEKAFSHGNAYAVSAWIKR